MLLSKRRRGEKGGGGREEKRVTKLSSNPNVESPKMTCAQCDQTKRKFSSGGYQKDLRSRGTKKKNEARISLGYHLRTNRHKRQVRH